MHRETLTEEHIAEDILLCTRFKKERKADIWLTHVAPPVLFFGSMLAAFLTRQMWLFLFPLAFFAVFIPVFYLGNAIRKRKHPDPVPRYTIAQDTLISITVETIASTHGRRSMMEDIFVMHFGVGDYRIMHDHYRWSKDLRLSAAGMYNTSVTGNTFYVIIDRETKDILCVYNEKFFACPDEILDAHSA